MNIIITQTEKHPVKASEFLIDKTNPKGVIVFGLARKRGDNLIYTTRYTDSLSSILEKHKLKLYTKQDENRDGDLGHRNNKLEMEEKIGLKLEFIGTAWNLRQELDNVKYKELITEIATALEEVVSPIDKDSNDKPADSNPGF